MHLWSHRPERYGKNQTENKDRMLNLKKAKFQVFEEIVKDSLDPSDSH